MLTERTTLALDNRELALIIWIGVAVFFVLASPKTRPAALRVLRCLISPYFVGLAFLAIAYVGLFATLFSSWGLWSAAAYKPTMIWLVVAAPFLIGQSLEAERGFFKDTVLRCLKIGVVLEFAINIFVFPIGIEILIMPIWFLAGACLVISQSDENLRPAAKFFSFVITTGVIYYLGHFFYNFHQDPTSVLQQSNAIALFLPIGWTLLFLPFVAMVTIYCAYENVFVSLNIENWQRLNSPLVKWLLIREFGWNYRRLQHEWRDFLSEYRKQTLKPD